MNISIKVKLDPSILYQESSWIIIIIQWTNTKQKGFRAVQTLLFIELNTYQSTSSTGSSGLSFGKTNGAFAGRVPFSAFHGLRRAYFHFTFVFTLKGPLLIRGSSWTKSVLSILVALIGTWPLTRSLKSCFFALDFIQRFPSLSFGPSLLPLFDADLLNKIPDDIKLLFVEWKQSSYFDGPVKQNKCDASFECDEFSSSLLNIEKP